MSADFTKVSDSLSSMFSNENAKPDKGNVLLITYKRGMSEVDGSPPLTPEKPFVRSHSKSTGMTLTEDSILEEEIEETRENSLKNSATHLLRPDRRRKSISSGESWGSEEGRTYREAQTNRQQSGSIRSDEESCGGGEGKVLTSPSSLSNTIWSIDSVSWASKDVKDDLVAPKDTKDDLVVAPKDWDGSFVHAVPSVPLASEDSDLGESADFESFSEDEEEEEKGDVTQTPENKDEFAGLGGFLNTRSLREKFRESRAFIRRSSEREVKVSRDSSPSSESFDSKFSSESRLSRLFSLRRSIGAGGGGSNHQDQTMPRVREEEDAPSPIPSLTPSPALNLSSLASKAKQVKRRCIINTLIESENSYVSSLQRIVHQYKGYLEDSNPPLLSATKLETLFFRVTDILNCHLSFREGLRAAISTWEKDEMIGGVFVSVFSNPDVLAAYSDFIINFNNAMDVVKTESKRKSAFADFLKVKTLQNFDR